MKKYLILFFSALLFINAQAQNGNIISSISGVADYVGMDSLRLSLMSAMERQSINRDISVIVDVNTLTGVDHFEVLLGSSEGSNDLFFREFTTSETGQFHDGASFTIDGNQLRMGLDIFQGSSVYYIEVVAIKNDGSREPMRTEIH